MVGQKVQKDSDEARSYGKIKFDELIRRPRNLIRRM